MKLGRSANMYCQLSIDFMCWFTCGVSTLFTKRGGCRGKEWKDEGDGEWEGKLAQKFEIKTRFYLAYQDGAFERRLRKFCIQFLPSQPTLHAARPVHHKFSPPALHLLSPLSARLRKML
jgi:hypothetical protein